MIMNITITINKRTKTPNKKIPTQLINKGLKSNIWSQINNFNSNNNHHHPYNNRANTIKVRCNK